MQLQKYFWLCNWPPVSWWTDSEAHKIIRVQLIFAADPCMLVLIDHTAPLLYALLPKSNSIRKIIWSYQTSNMIRGLVIFRSDINTDYWIRILLGDATQVSVVKLRVRSHILVNSETSLWKVNGLAYPPTTRQLFLSWKLLIKVR